MRKQRRLNLYYISNDYIDYLRKFDDKVRFNKNHSRPYVGIVYTYNNNNYFAPLSSPKPKYQKTKKTAIDIWLIDEGKLGVINFNNMIPCPIKLVELLDLQLKRRNIKIIRN